MRDVFELEPTTQIPQDSSYILSYPYLRAFFQKPGPLNVSDLVVGAHFVYGWMPTALDLYVDPKKPDLERGTDILNSAKAAGELLDRDLSDLMRLINNSLVGTSKLLHFLRPDGFPIWDSKTYAFVFEEKPHHYRVNEISRYREYQGHLARIQERDAFTRFHASMITKVGYEISPLRSIELVMFLNAPAFARPGRQLTKKSKGIG